MTNVFILAAGSATRFGGAIKQLLPYRGEPIIRRTIRLLKEDDPTIQPYVVTWHNELKFSDVKVIDTKTQPSQLSDTILLTEPYWGDKNVLLLGDVVYTESAIRNILANDNGISIFYRDRCPNKPHSERFALTFPKEYSDVLKELCIKSARIFKGTDFEDAGGFYKLCYATHKESLLPYVSPVKCNKYIRPFRDFIIFHIYPAWKPKQTLTLVPISDLITTDVDTKEDYENLLLGNKPDITFEPKTINYLAVVVLLYIVALLIFGGYI